MNATRRPFSLPLPGMVAKRGAVLMAALLLAALCQRTGVATSLDRALDPLRFAVLSRPASGHIAVVEMDARSAATINRWPWPRVHYARVVDALRRAGAASITFDVDLSSRSAAGDDAVLAAALARTDGLVALPTFAQQAGSADHRSIDALPVPILRPHVALASVSMMPDADGLVREAPLGTMTSGLPHPSVSAYIAHRSGAADDSFPIAYEILPASIPRLSFVAVRDGRFDPAMVKGRDILIGATAIEMGDRYSTPRWGNLPGVVIQALAAETLLGGVPRRLGALAPITAAVLLTLAVLAATTPRRIAAATAMGIGLLIVGALVAQRHGVIAPIAAALILLIGAAGGRVALEILARFGRQRLVDRETGLPTRHALLDTTEATSDCVLVALVDNLDSLAAVLPSGAEHQLMLRLAERLQVATAGGVVHRIADRMLAVVPTTGDPARWPERLREVLLAPVEVAGRRADAAVSIGLDATEAPLAQRLATATLAAEGAARHGSFWRRDAVDLAEVDQQVSLMGDLSAAIRANEIVVHYQPKLCLRTHRIASVEALVRWRRADGEMVSPAMFVPLAEQTGRIGPLTLHVLGQALDDLAAWTRAGHRLTAAVNISATLLGDGAFDERVTAMLADAAVPTDRLIFEVTESAALTDSADSLASLNRFHAQGIALSMDDYGTGQSTLSYLRQLPLSELKIDRSFVEHVAVDRRDEAMVRSTIELAHELGLRVVAEGIEDAACLARLEQLGCDYAQGYHISRPVPAERIATLLAGEERQAA